MEQTIYWVCAVAGCTLVGIQVVLQIFGLADTDADVGDGHVDVDGHGAHVGDGDHGGNVFFGVLSFKALCAFAGLFGLVGLILLKRDFSAPSRIAMAAGAGVGGMFAVGWMMRGLSRLQASGNVKIENAVGLTGTVYLRIPGAASGLGKVTVELQGRSMEFAAVTKGEEIATGAQVVVDSVSGERLTVSPVSKGGR